MIITIVIHDYGHIEIVTTLCPQLIYLKVMIKEDCAEAGDDEPEEKCER